MGEPTGFSRLVSSMEKRDITADLEIRAEQDTDLEAELDFALPAREGIQQPVSQPSSQSRILLSDDSDKCPPSREQDSEWMTYLENLFVTLTFHDPQNLQGRCSPGNNHVADITDQTEMAAMSFPFNSFLMTRLFRGMIALTFFNFLFVATLACRELANAPPSVREVRFSLGSDFQGRSPLGVSPNASKVGLLRKSCPVRFPDYEETATSNSFTLKFSRQVTLDGWFLDVGQLLPPGLSPITVEALSETGSVLHQFAPPGCWHCYQSAEQNFTIQGNAEFNAPVQPDSRLHFSVVNSAPDLLGHLIFSVIFLVMCPFFCWLRWRGHVRAIRRVLLFMFSSGSVVALSMILLRKMWTGELSLGWMRAFFLNSMVAVTLRAQGLQKVYQHVLWMCGVVDGVALAWAARQTVGGGGSYLELQEAGLFVILVASGWYCTWFRWNVVKQAMAEASTHVARFDEAFREVESDEGLQDLRDCCATWTRYHNMHKIPHHGVRKLEQNQQKETGTAPESDADTPGLRGGDVEEWGQTELLREQNISGAKLAPTMHQLFVQAAVCRVLLHSVITELGSCALTQALLPCKRSESPSDLGRSSAEEDGGERETRAPTAPGLACVQPPGHPDNRRLAWSSLKSQNEAIATAHLLYGGDMTRVVDLCHETLLFARCHQLAAFLNALHASQSVSVLRLRASFHPAPSHRNPRLDADFATGFRGVVVDLRVVTPRAHELCVDKHVCKLVLALAPMARCLSEEETQSRLTLCVLLNDGAGSLSSMRYHSPVSPYALRSMLGQLPVRFGSCVRETWHTVTGLGPDRASPTLTRRDVTRNALASETQADLVVVPDLEAGGPGPGLPVPVDSEPGRQESLPVDHDQQLEVQVEGPGPAPSRSPSVSRLHSQESRSGATGSCGRAVSRGASSEARAGRERSLESVSGVGRALSRVASSLRFPVERVSSMSRSGMRVVRLLSLAPGVGDGMGDTEPAWRKKGPTGWGFLSAAFRTNVAAEVIEKNAALVKSSLSNTKLMAFRTSSAVNAVMKERKFRIFLFVLAILALVVTLRSASSINADDHTASQLAFRTHALRGGGNPRDAKVARVGLLLDGCMLPEQGEQRQEGGDVLLDLGQAEARFNGFFWVTAHDAPPDLDPVVFSLEARGPDGAWRVVGSSRRFVRLSDELVWLLRPGARAPPEERASLVKVDLRPRVVERSTFWLWLAVFLGFFSAASVLDASWGNTVFVWVAALAGAGRVAGFASVLLLDGAWSLNGVCGANLWICAGLIHMKPSLLPEIAAAGMIPLWLVLPCVESIMVHGRVADFETSFGSLGIGLAFLLLVVMRRHQVWRARRLVQADIDSYNSLWVSLQATDAQGLAEIQTAMACLDQQLRCAPGTLRQLSYQLDDTHRRACIYATISDAYYSPDALSSLHVVEPSLPSAASSPDAGHSSRKWMNRLSFHGSTHSTNAGSRSQLSVSQRLASMPFRIRSTPGPEFLSRTLHPLGGSDSSPGTSSRSLRQFSHEAAPSRAQACAFQDLFPHARPMADVDRLYSPTKKSPVDFMQLYTLAAAVQPLLSDKVEEWGTASEGMCALSRGGFVPWRDVRDSLVQPFMLRRGTLKRPRRAAEKLHRAYGQQASKLLDLCRDSIVFEQPADLASCVHAILADDDVEVMGCKNRFKADYDARNTCGYRDVVLFVRFRSPVAERLRLDLVLCELQLLLKDFALLKNEKGHARYVQFRDARGE